MGKNKNGKIDTKLRQRTGITSSKLWLRLGSGAIIISGIVLITRYNLNTENKLSSTSYTSEAVPKETFNLPQKIDKTYLEELDKIQSPSSPEASAKDISSSKDYTSFGERSENENTKIKKGDNIASIEKKAQNMGALRSESEKVKQSNSTKPSISSANTSNANTRSNSLTSSVSWASSSVNIANNAGKLNWSTSMEANTAYYIIERSETGNFFEKIGQVEAAKDIKSTENNLYSFSDQTLMYAQMPRVYYRIKHVGLDGRERYSQPIQYDLKLNLGLYAKILNTSTDSIHLRIASDKQTIMDIQMIDPAGNVISTASINTELTPTETTLTFPKIDKGDYFLFLSDGNNSMTEPFSID